MNTTCHQSINCRNKYGSTTIFCTLNQGAQESDFTIVFLHGVTGNRHWWNRITSYSGRFPKSVAIDLSGCGDSGRRGKYSPLSHALEIEAVLNKFVPNERLIVVAHNLSYLSAIEYSCSTKRDIAATVFVDPLLTTRLFVESHVPWIFRSFHRPEKFETLEECVSAFCRSHTLFGDDTQALFELVEQSVDCSSNGFSWKGDPHYISKFEAPLDGANAPIAFASVASPAFFILGDLGNAVSRSQLDVIRLCSETDRITRIKGAGDNSFIDKPEEFRSVLNNILEQIGAL